ncbi:MAG TPA: DUF4190 domain-containing protein [Pirellulales bacterium]|jgi:hypothetical protein|nr:DUF4190 domain-containing protein [Pirellulales bacterium]
MSVELERAEVEPAGVESYAQYRALSAMAVISGVLGLLSISAMLTWSLFVIPVAGIITGTLALRRIRANPAEYTGEGFALAGSMLSMLFLVAGASWLSYCYATEVPEGHQRISYDLLQPDEKTPNQIVPPSAQELDGKKVFIKGYVYQPSGGQMTGLKQFVLVRDKGQCCFGGNPKLTDMILVKLQGSLTAEFNMSVVKLAGTFHVEPAMGTDGLGGVIYQLEADHLQ